MNEWLTTKYVAGKYWFEKFKKDEAGVSPLIATVLILLVVSLLAAVFWQNISEWYNNLWEAINVNTFDDGLIAPSIK